MDSVDVNNGQAKMYAGSELNDDNRDQIMGDVPEELRTIYGRVIDRIQEKNNEEGSSPFAIIEDALVNLSVDVSSLSSLLSMEKASTGELPAPTTQAEAAANVQNIMSGMMQKSQGLSALMGKTGLANSATEAVLLCMLVAKGILENSVAEAQREGTLAENGMKDAETADSVLKGM